MPSFFFYLFATILIFASLAVVLARNPLYNVLALVVAIFSLSCLFVLLEAFFVGMVLLLVYAGAVLVFFLFVVMCLKLNTAALDQAWALLHSKGRLKSSAKFSLRIICCPLN